jgi:hypothetical protein
MLHINNALVFIVILQIDTCILSLAIIPNSRTVANNYVTGVYLGYNGLN